jgi:hypothetical protein
MTSPTLYQDLHKKAMAWCREFEQYKEECKVFAEQLRVDYLTDLGAKSTDLEFHVLDERLERMPSEGTTLSPRLQVGDDGFLYFGVTLFFKEACHCLDEHVRVGIQRSRGQWKVRWGRIEAPYAVNGSHAAFFDRVTAALAEKFATPFHKFRGQLGFVPSMGSNDHLVLVPVGEARIAAEAGHEDDKNPAGAA